MWSQGGWTLAASDLSRPPASYMRSSSCWGSQTPASLTGQRSAWSLTDANCGSQEPGQEAVFWLEGLEWFWAKVTHWSGEQGVGLSRIRLKSRRNPRPRLERAQNECGRAQNEVVELRCPPEKSQGRTGGSEAQGGLMLGRPGHLHGPIAGPCRRPETWICNGTSGCWARVRLDSAEPGYRREHRPG